MNQDIAAADYMLGYSDAEIRRLIRQAALLRPATERLLRSAGIDRGMRVLDLGCGAGDGSFLAAELVGPSGSVLGIDRSTETLTAARMRAAAAGLPQVAFAESAIDDFTTADRFDAVICRYVLIYQPSPTEVIRKAASLLRPGGVVAVHEPTLSEVLSLPLVPLWQEAGRWLLDAFWASVSSPDVADRLVQVFTTAGLPSPTLSAESLIGGGDRSPLYAWIAEIVRSAMPYLLRTGIASAEEIGIDTLEARLRQAVTDARSQIIVPPQICAWARRP